MTLKEKLRDIDFYIERIMENTPVEYRDDVVKHIIKKIDKQEPNMMSASEMSENGLIVLINYRFLHPLGLALAWNPDRNRISGCIVAPDFKWEYDEQTLESNREKYNNFIDNQEKILTTILER
jgi:hypothetical protein